MRDNSQFLENQSLAFPDPESYQPIFHKGKKAFKCTFPGCEKIILYKSDMERHVVAHIETKPFICSHPGCRRTFKREDAMRSHLQSHNEQFEFVCSEPDCRAKFKKKATLQYHVTKYHSTPSFVCQNPKCMRAFSTYKGLRKHQGAGCDSENIYYAAVFEHEENKIDQVLPACENFEFPDIDFEYNPLSSALHLEEIKSPKPDKRLHIENGGDSFEKRQVALNQASPSVTSFDHQKENTEPNLDMKGPLQFLVKNLQQENQKLRERLQEINDQLQREDFAQK